MAKKICTTCKQAKACSSNHKPTKLLNLLAKICSSNCKITSQSLQQVTQIVTNQTTCRITSTKTFKPKPVTVSKNKTTCHQNNQTSQTISLNKLNTTTKQDIKIPDLQSQTKNKFNQPAVQTTNFQAKQACLNCKPNTKLAKNVNKL